MDVPRPREIARRKTVRSFSIAAAVLVLLGGALLAVGRLKPAAPSVDANELYLGTVKRGDMERKVSGIGHLAPEEIYFLAAAVDSRVAQVLRHPGLDPVRAKYVLIVLSNPTLELDAEKAEWQVKQDESALLNLRIKLGSDKLDQRASLADLESQYSQAKLQADRDVELTRLNLKSDLESRLSVNKAEQLQKRVALQSERLSMTDQSIAAQLTAQQVILESSRAAYELKRKEVDALSGVDGVLQEVDVEVGQRVTAGSVLAKVADPHKLKAVLNVPEAQMKDVRIGQEATIDTRNGLISGRVIRINPAAQNGTVAVDVGFSAPLPQDARPELSVNGTIEIEKLVDIVVCIT